MEQSGSNGSTSLTEKQLQALPYLVGASSRSEAARLAEVGRTTLYRWMEDWQFREELERLRRQALDLAHAEIKGLMLKAVQVLGESMDDANPFVRLRAAQTTLSMGSKMVETTELQRRLDILEDALRLWQKRNSIW